MKCANCSNEAQTKDTLCADCRRKVMSDDYKAAMMRLVFGDEPKEEKKGVSNG